MKKENFKNRKNKKIVVLVEECPDKKGLVFIMHGLGGRKEQPHIITMAQSFYDNGYTTVRFDITNSIGESDGKLEFATVTNYYEDLEDVLQWVKTQEWYQEPFSLAGHSLGSFCVFFYAENHPERVKALVSISGLVSGELFVKAFKEKEGLEKLEQWEKRGYREWESSSMPGLI